jgi:hypothetical protein
LMFGFGLGLDKGFCICEGYWMNTAFTKFRVYGV